jgi:hypothetical protein
MYFPNNECDFVAALLATGSHGPVRVEIICFRNYKPERWWRRKVVPAHYHVSLSSGYAPAVSYYEGRGQTPEKAVRSAVRAMFNNDAEPNLL